MEVFCRGSLCVCCPIFFIYFSPDNWEKMWNFVWELNLCLGGLWGVYNIMRRILGQTLQKPEVVPGSRGGTVSVGVGLGFPELFQLPLPRSNLISQLLRHWSLPEQSCETIPPVFQHCHSPRGAFWLGRGFLQGGQGWEVKCNLLRATSTELLSEPCPLLQWVDVLQEHFPCVWGDLWDIWGEEKAAKKVVLDVLHPSRENWLQPWLVKGCLWGLEAFSLQFENPCCVKLFNTHDSIDFKVDNHHWALNTQSLLLELQLFFVNTNIKYLFWIRIIW